MSSCDAASSFIDKPPKSNSRSKSESRMSASAAGVELDIFPRSFSKVSMESVGYATGAEVCFKPVPLGRRDEVSSEAEDSEDTSDSEEPLGDGPWRCEVT